MISPETDSSKVRFACGVEYRGSDFCGWQSQSGVPTVQDALEKALGRVANHPLRVIAAGRTDTGVHAFGQVIHFETPSQREPYAWMRGTNTWLPDGVSVLWVKPVDNSFHARFSARQRAYRYIILNRRMPAAVYNKLVTTHFQPLDVERMQVAAKLLQGRHDFSAFRAAGCQAKTPVRDLRKISIQRYADWIAIDVVADAFLHHMVRNLTGVLLRIGEGLEAVDWAAEVLAGRDRRLGGVTAPADGLYLTRVDYDTEYQLPQAAVECRFW